MGTPELDTDAAFILNIKAGNYFRQDLLITDENDLPYNLTVATVLHLSIKKKYSDDDATEVTGKDLTTFPQPDLSIGIIRIILTETDTDDSMVGRFKWDVRIVAPGIDSPVNIPDPAAEAVITGRIRRTD